MGYQWVSQLQTEYAVSGLNLGPMAESPLSLPHNPKKFNSDLGATGRHVFFILYAPHPADTPAFQRRLTAKGTFFETAAGLFRDGCLTMTEHPRPLFFPLRRFEA